MKTLQEIKQEIDQLSDEEQNEILVYMIQQRRNIGNILTPEERVRRFNAAFDAMSEGLTAEELNRIADAMNESYIEPIDEDGFPLL